MSYSVVARHGFETAHRLPHLGSACASIHGRSWQAAVTVGAPSLNGDGTVVVIARAACQALEEIPHADGAPITEVVIAEASANTAIWCLEGAP